MDAQKELAGASGDDKLKDFKAKVQVLIHYKFIDQDLNLLYKGKVSEVIHSNKFLTTELIFSGLLKELTNEEIVGVISAISVMRGTKRDDASDDYVSEAFTKALDFLEEEANRLMTIEQKYGVQDAPQDILEYLDMSYFGLLYDWAC